MKLNELKPVPGANRERRRVGRGIGSGLGKTAGRGHKGQSSRAGGFHKVGFEGGQMPLQRRLPKRGFVSHKRDDTAEVRLTDLERIGGDTVDLNSLKAGGIVPRNALRAKVILAGQITRTVVLKGIAVSKGAKAAIEAVGGTIELPEVKVVEGKKAERRKAFIAKAKERAEARSAGKQAGGAGDKPSKAKKKPESKVEGKPKTDAKPKAKKGA